MDPEAGKGGKGPSEETKGVVKKGAYYTITTLWILGAFTFWVVALAGISRAQNQCRDAPELNGVVLFSTPVVLPALSCGKIFRFMWWTVWLEFVTLVLVLLVMASKALSNARSMAVGFLAVATVMLMISADKFLNMIDLTSGSLRIGARVAFAGFLVCSVFNFFTMYMVGINY